ncbi:MAG TPA: HlyD family secretion protein [Rhizomicrobium sp.]|nr:HlyD family secretion protein [Rhizomicrobium sp.]
MSTDRLTRTDPKESKRGIRGSLKRTLGDMARLRQILMIGGVVIVAVASLAFYLMGGRYVSTDDAYVKAAQLMVSTDVSGLVKSVEVHEGQHVKAGDVLFRIDPLPFQIALENAKAAMATTAQTVEATKADYRRDIQQVGAQAAQVAVSKTTLDRYSKLVSGNAIAHTLYDQQRATYLSAQATLDSLKQAAQVDLAKLSGNPNLPVEQSPAYMQAQAQVDEMQRQLDHTIVRAPFDGVVTQVDSLQPGTLVISAMSAFSTTSAVGLVSDNVWVEGNMKETDLTYVKHGMPVDVTVDTYPGYTWKGTIQSVAAASGSTFSPLPSENSSGNWVKVVQRIAVRVKLERKADEPRLRAGMSSIISIDTGQRRWNRLING